MNSVTKRLFIPIHTMLPFFVVALILVTAIVGPLISPHDPSYADPARSLHPPSAEYWLGTDKLGRDQFSRSMFGLRESLRIAIVGVALAVIFGGLVGLVSAYKGRVTDEIVMRIMDALASFPAIVMAMALVVVIGENWRNVVVAITLVMTPWIARTMRSQVLSIKEREYVMAATSIGSSPIRIMLQHILLNCLSPVIVSATLGLGSAIVMESSLSFLGIGVKPPIPTLGGLLRHAFTTIEIAPWLAIAPGVIIFLVVLSFNLAGDALRDLLDPRLKGIHLHKPE